MHIMMINAEMLASMAHAFLMMMMMIEVCGIYSISMMAGCIRTIVRTGQQDGNDAHQWQQYQCDEMIMRVMMI